MPFQLDFSLVWDDVICHEQDEGGGSNPYLWSLVFFVDGGGVSIGPEPTFSLSGQVTVLKTRGDLNNLGRRFDDVKRGDVLRIPTDIGRFMHSSWALQLPRPWNGLSPGGVPGFAGVIAVLLENDGLVEEAVLVGYDSLASAVQTVLDEFLSGYSLAEGPPSPDKVEELKSKIISATKARIRSHLLQPVFSGGNGLPAAEAFLGSEDDTLLTGFWLLPLGDLHGAGDQPLQHREARDGHDFEIRGRVGVAPGEGSLQVLGEFPTHPRRELPMGAGINPPKVETLPLDLSRVMVSLTEIRCSETADGRNLMSSDDKDIQGLIVDNAPVQPYLWPVAFIIDGEGFQISVDRSGYPEAFTLHGACRMLRTSGHPSNLAGFDVLAGSTIAIPEETGVFIFETRPIELPPEGRALAPEGVAAGFVGMVVVLMEHDAMSPEDATFGYDTLASTLEEEVNRFVSRRSIFAPAPDAAEIASIQGAVESRVTAALTQRLTSGGLPPLNPDDALFSQSWLISIDDLRDKPVESVTLFRRTRQPLSARKVASSIDWELVGTVSAWG